MPLKNKVITKELIGLCILFLMISGIMFLSLRGYRGNPSVTEINSQKWKGDGPFELSPERGRFALLYSIVENGSVYFTPDIGRFAVPDLGYYKGNYVSLFAPALSFIVAPGYIIGKFLGNAQIGAFAIVALFAILNVFLIYLITKRIGGTPLAGIIAGLVFLFATPAYSYAVTLYQHHISTFMLLISLYAFMRWDNYKALLVLFFVYPLAISVDYPNFFLMFPLGIFSLTYFFKINQIKDKIALRIKPLYIITLIAAVFPVLFFFWFNNASYGNPLQLAGTVSQVKEINDAGLPAAPKDFDAAKLGMVSNLVGQDRSAFNYFATRPMLNGLYILMISPDRGVITYAPILVLAIFGMVLLHKEKNKYFGLLVSIAAVNLTLYTMWGDPWGGWAFGARYLIPAYSITAIFIGKAISHYKKKIIFMIILIGMFSYSAYVNTAGALTSSANPPKAEVLYLEKLSGVVQKYTFERNLDQLKNNTSKSFVFIEYAKNTMSAWEYFKLIYTSILIITIPLIIGLYFSDLNLKSKLVQFIRKVKNVK